MKLLYSTDLHGSKWKYETILKLAKSLNLDLVINGGDMFPLSNLLAQDKFIIQYLDEHFAKYHEAKIHYLCYPGNDDLQIFDNLLLTICENYDYVNSIPQRKVQIDGYEFIGFNYVLDYPFILKDRCRIDNTSFEFPRQLGTAVISTFDHLEPIQDWFSFALSLPSIEVELDALVKPHNFNNTIYIIHQPPANLGLDVCSDGRKVGSQSIFKFIEKYQPQITLHGHIHESPEISMKWIATLGKTLSVQPGQYPSHRKKLIYVIMDLETMSVQRYKIE
jgi:Icc-related predicted phosphoesterase